MVNSTNFKQELKALLEKYDAHINFHVSDCSDTHGIYDERLEVEFYELKKGYRFKTPVKTVTLSHGWTLDKTDL